MKYLIRIVSLVFVLCGFLPSRADVEVADPQWTSGRLPNGLRYFIRQNDKPEDRLLLRLAVNAGSVLEKPDQQGLAHFLEHVAFNGTEHFEKNEMVRFLESLGMAFGPDLNAYTSFDETVYKLKVPTEDAEVVEQAYLILSDWAGAITASEEAIENERGVVIEEWRGSRGARARLRDKQYPVLFPGSRYAERLPIGKLEVLKTFDPERLRDFYRDWYRPELMTVIAVGDLDVAETEKRIREYFSDLESPEDPPKRETYTHPSHEKTMVGVFSDPELTSSEVSIVWKMPPQRTRTEEDYRRDVKQGLIVSMLRQRLAELTQKADAPFLSAGAYRGSYTRGGDAYLLYAGVRDREGAYTEAARALLRESERARRYGFTESELQRAKAERLRAVEQAYKERNTTDSEAFTGEMVRHALTGEIVPGIERELEMHREMLPEVTVEELREMFRSWISEENRVIMAEGPSDEGKTRLPSEEALLSVFDEVGDMELESYDDGVSDEPLVAEPPEPGAVIERSEIPELGITEWRLSNGARVVLKPTDFKEDQVLLHAWSPGGTSLASEEEWVHARSADAVASATGMGAFSAVDLGKKLSGKLANLSAFIGPYREGVGGSASPEDLETLFELLHLRFTDTREDAEAFAAMKDRLRESIRNRLANPKAEFNEMVNLTLHNYHPRLQPLTLEEVDRIDMERALAFFESRFANAGDFTFYLTGSFSPEEVEPLFTRWVASLPATSKDESPEFLDPGFPEYEVRRSMSKGMEPVSQVRMVWTSEAFEWDYDSRYAVQSLVAALRIRMREVVREEEGGTYHVSVWPEFRHRPEPLLRMHVLFGCDPDRVEDLIAKVEEVIGQAVREPMEERIVSTVRETQRRQREEGLKENSFWNSVLPFYDWHNEDPLILTEFESYVSSLTAEDIRATAERYFTVPHRAVFVLRPAEAEGAAATEDGE